MLKMLKCWQQLKKFHQLPKEHKKIVFYSEGHTYWVHFEQMIQHLIHSFDQTICYVTSQEDDPILKNHHKHIIPIYIGDGMVRTLFFKSFDAPLMILTMPDLEKFHLKRSIHPVHYAYIYHSLVSTHMIYRQGAFDHYDTIFCAGPHHVGEIRATEKHYGLKPKNLIEHGYGRLDSIYSNQNNHSHANHNDEKKNILIGPSWGVNNILESVGYELIDLLLKNNYRVTVRPHPHALKRQKKMIQDLVSSFQQNPDFSFESDVTSFQSLVTSHMLITDWSGVAFDYAFGLEKPVIFLDVPPKVNNPEFQQIAIEPIESALRSQLGRLVSINDMAQLPQYIDELLLSKADFLDDIRKLRSAYVYHLGHSGDKGAQAIMALANEKKECVV